MSLSTPHSHSVLGYLTSVQNMESKAPAAPALPAAFLPGEPAPALPEVPAPALETQEAVLDVGIWIVEGTDDLDESGVRHKNAFYVLLNEWFKGRDYTCTNLCGAIVLRSSQDSLC